MKTTPRKHWIKKTGVAALLMLSASLAQAQTTTTNSNNLTVLGSLAATNSLYYGTAISGGSTNFGVFQNYTDSSKSVGFLATPSNSLFLWQDGGIGTANNKMLLDGSNNLSLYGTNGSVGIVLNPNAGGGIKLSGSSAGITFADGTTLNSASGGIVELNSGNNLVVPANSVNIGASCTAGVNAAAFGNSTIASGSYSVAGGYGCNVTGTASAAFGVYNTVSGSYAAAFGFYNNATASYSSAFGDQCNASGMYSTAMGIRSSAIGAGSIAIGGVVTASGTESMAVGNGANASGMYSVAFGYYTRAAAHDSVALGYCNVGLVSATGSNNWIATDPVLEIGNGTYSTPGNAVTVLKNGKLRAAGTIESPAGVRIPQMGDMSMGSFTAGNNPAQLTSTNGLVYPGGN